MKTRGIVFQGWDSAKTGMTSTTPHLRKHLSAGAIAALGVRQDDAKGENVNVI
jgi:hypothetical protein